MNKNEIFVKPHKGAENANAGRVERETLTECFIGFANTVGEATPLRHREVKDGSVFAKYDTKQYTLLPAACTWEQLHHQCVLYHKTIHPELYHPVQQRARDEVEQSQKEKRDAEFSPVSFSMFVKIVSEDCLLIKIRSHRENVCDICSIYKHQAPQGASAQDDEVLGREYGEHVEAAKQMRYVNCDHFELKHVLQGINSHFVLVCPDFSISETRMRRRTTTTSSRSITRRA